MMSDELAAIRERRAKITPGPYQQCGAARGGCQCGNVWSKSADVRIASFTGEDDEEHPVPKEVQEANAQFYVNAPTDIDTLLSLLAERDAEIERLRRILAHVPARIAIQAKESAGFPESIRTQEL